MPLFESRESRIRRLMDAVGKSLLFELHQVVEDEY